jgi:SSS family solute:Na+ symporter
VAHERRVPNPVNVQLLLLVAYSALLVALGVWIGRRVSSAQQFFVAGRSLGPVLLGATLLAANIGAGSTVGAASLGYEHGFSAWWWVGSAGIGTLLLAWWVGPRIWRVAREHDLLTVGDYLEWRYDSRVRLAATLLLWVITPAVLAAQLVAVSFILNAVAGVPFVWGCLLGGVVMTLYFTGGGLLASAWVNLVQLAVLALGLVGAVVVAGAAAGGIESVLATLPAAAEFTSFVVADGPGWHYMFFLVPAFMVSPGLLQKVYGARDVRTVRIGVGAAGLLLLAFAIVPVLLGMYARVWDASLVGTATDHALPLVLTMGLPLGLGALGLAAVFSAELSSADAVLFMLSTSLSEDLYRRFINPGASDHEVLRVARLGAIAGGVLGTILAIVLGSVIVSLKIFYSLLTVSLFVPIIGGLFWRRPGMTAGLAGLVAGVAGYLLGHYGLGPGGGSLWSPTTVGLAASAAAYLVAAVASREQPGAVKKRR